MEKSEINSLIKELMKALNLRQVDLADILGVKIDRVKSITSGKVKNLSREETEALIKKKNVRAEWLATGKGPMFQNEDEIKLTQQLEKISRLVEKVMLPGISKDVRRRAFDVLSAIETENVEMLAQCLGEHLTGDEKIVLDIYRRISPQERETFIKMLSSLSSLKIGDLDDVLAASRENNPTETPRKRKNNK